MKIFTVVFILFVLNSVYAQTCDKLNFLKNCEKSSADGIEKYFKHCHNLSEDAIDCANVFFARHGRSNSRSVMKIVDILFENGLKFDKKIKKISVRNRSSGLFFWDLAGVELTKKLLSKGMNPDIAVLGASSFANLEKMKLLLDSNANVNVTSEYNDNSIYEVQFSHDYEDFLMSEEEVEKKYAKFPRDRKDKENAKKEVAGLLIDKGINLHHKNSEGKTPLEITVKSFANYHFAEWLIEEGALMKSDYCGDNVYCHKWYSCFKVGGSSVLSDNSYYRGDLKNEQSGCKCGLFSIDPSKEACDNYYENFRDKCRARSGEMFLDALVTSGGSVIPVCKCDNGRKINLHRNNQYCEMKTIVKFGEKVKKIGNEVKDTVSEGVDYVKKNLGM